MDTRIISQFAALSFAPAPPRSCTSFRTSFVAAPNATVREVPSELIFSQLFCTVDLLPCFSTEVLVTRWSPISRSRLPGGVEETPIESEPSAQQRRRTKEKSPDPMEEQPDPMEEQRPMWHDEKSR